MKNTKNPVAKTVYVAYFHDHELDKWLTHDVDKNKEQLKLKVTSFIKDNWFSPERELYLTNNSFTDRVIIKQYKLIDK